MATLTENEIRQALFMRVNQAQVHHDLFVSLRECTAEQENLVRFNRNLRFFSGVESALFNSTIILLYSIYERRLDTANFPRLIDQISTRIPQQDLETYLARVSEIKSTWVRVSVIRNELVGHQTLERDRAAAELKAGLKFSDVDALLVHARELLFDISTQHFDTHVEYLENSRDATRMLLSKVAL